MPLVDSRDVPFEKEREIFDQLLNDFQSKSEPGSLLLVNTLGWVDGLGAELLEHIFDITQPCLALSLSDDCGTFTIPSWVPKILRIYPIPANTLCRLAMSDKRPTRLQASQLRDLRIISYFSSVLPRPVLSSICDATPYCVKFKKLERILGDDSLPLVSIIQEGSPLLKCHGFGLCIAFCPTEHEPFSAAIVIIGASRPYHIDGDVEGSHLTVQYTCSGLSASSFATVPFNRGNPLGGEPAYMENRRRNIYTTRRNVVEITKRIVLYTQLVLSGKPIGLILYATEEMDGLLCPARVIQRSRRRQIFALTRTLSSVDGT
ncbi:hypothetical protein KIN20_018340 [Parelaphostrongylus tenuis]|uniref:Clp1 P-loop domain-containing protein n=1 Tax=Parelaphostrongylus tenuis TaxID=148309 RepID=A0AAD5QS43_PARTN|nr:hypothetical protein KIN20_018340 [Parelaphostrongylus tenuis]